MAIKGVCVSESGKIGKNFVKVVGVFLQEFFVFHRFRQCFCRMTGSVHEELQVTGG